MLRRCDGSDPNLLDGTGPDRKPCACGLVFDDVLRMVIFPHDQVHGLSAGEVLQVKGHGMPRAEGGQGVWP